MRYVICTVLARCHVIEVKHSNKKNKKQTQGSNHVLESSISSKNQKPATLLVLDSHQQREPFHQKS